MKEGQTSNRTKVGKKERKKDEEGKTADETECKGTKIERRGKRW